MRTCLDPRRIVRALRAYARYAKQWRQYAGLPGAEPLNTRDAYPCLYDNTVATPIDPHYFYQQVWAMKVIRRSGAPLHVDVGSLASFVGMLTAVTKVIFIDIRPLKAELENLECRAGTILEMPFDDGAVESLSCLHVAEHIGLGRYGDPLDPAGTSKAARELSRVLAPGGNLYFSVPVGRPRVCFNAHRIHSPEQIIDYFGYLKLVSFSGVDDRGRFHDRIAPRDLANCKYGCGFFHFTREKVNA